MKNKTTIKEIAKDLQLSISTVSRALSDSWDVSEETRERVLEAAKRLDYHPNLMARYLGSERTGVIGVVVPEFSYSFFPNVILGIQDVLNENDYRFLITQSAENAEMELKNIRLLEGNNVDGIILSIAKEGENDEAYRELIAKGTPMVFFNRVPEYIDAPKVTVDDFKLSFVMVEYLIQKGYKRIAHIKGLDGLSITNKRLEGYLAALKKYNIDDSFIIDIDNISIDGGMIAADKILAMEPRPDAVFAFSDSVAIGVVKAIKKSGLRIPEDIAVAGFTDLVLSSVIEPALTTIKQPGYEIGKQAALLILENIRKKRRMENKWVFVEAELIEREST